MRREAAIGPLLPFGVSKLSFALKEKNMKTQQTGKIMKTSERTVSEIVTHDYRTASVFESHGIDFCCGVYQSTVKVEDNPFDTHRQAAFT